MRPPTTPSHNPPTDWQLNSTKLHTATAQPISLYTEEDLATIELFCRLLADLLQTPSSFKDMHETAKYITLLPYNFD